MPDNKQLEAQEALDDLFNQHVLPFRLDAHMVGAVGLEAFIVYFYDSRLHSVDVTCGQGDSFKDVVRDAVLEQVKKLSVPLRTRSAAHGQTNLPVDDEDDFVG